MIRLRPYKPEDAKAVLSWSKDERAFYQWSAGVLGQYPITEEEFRFVESLMAFTAFDEDGVLGFFTLRNPGEDPGELRIGFVIVDPARRGQGCGKEMLRSALRYAFDICGARKVTLGVFENNLSAYHCYRSVGFREIVPEEPETYQIMGEAWRCREMAMERRTE